MKEIVLKVIIVIFLFWIITVTFASCTALPVIPDIPEQSTVISGTLGDVLVVYTEWEGLVNPHDFRDWRVIKHRPCPDGYADYHILLQNPMGNPDAVEIVVIPYGETQLLVIKYGYRMDDVFYVFSTTSGNGDKYVQVQPREV